MKKAAKRQLLFWLCLAVFLIALIALLNDILLPFVVAIGIAYFLDPLVDKLEKAGLGRTTATVVLVIITGLVLVLALVFLHFNLATICQIMKMVARLK